MIVCIICEHIEHGTLEQFVNFRLWNLKFPAGAEHIFVTVSVRVHGGQGLHEAFLTVLAVKAACQEMPGPFHLNKAAVHHGDAALTGHLEVRHFRFRQGMFRRVELDDTVLKFRAGTGLAGVDAPVWGNGNDGLHLSAAGRCPDGRECTACKWLSGRNALAGKLLLYQLGLLVQAVYPHLFIIVKAAV